MRDEHDVRPIRPRLAPIYRNTLHDIRQNDAGNKLDGPNRNIPLDHTSATPSASVTLSLSKGARAHGSVSSACVRSARMSAIDSIPTDNRTASSLTPLAI